GSAGDQSGGEIARFARRIEPGEQSGDARVCGQHAGGLRESRGRSCRRRSMFGRTAVGAASTDASIGADGCSPFCAEYGSRVPRYVAPVVQSKARRLLVVKSLLDPIDLILIAEALGLRTKQPPRTAQRGRNRPRV